MSELLYINLGATEIVTFLHCSKRSIGRFEYERPVFDMDNTVCVVTLIIKIFTRMANLPYGQYEECLLHYMTKGLRTQYFGCICRLPNPEIGVHTVRGDALITDPL